MNMMNPIQIFNFEGRTTRIIDVDGQPWWVAKDVAEILGIDNVSQALARLDEDERNTIILNEGIGNPERAIVNEAGLYSLILGSRKPAAKAFKRWVTHEVIPSIRKHGLYMTPQKMDEFLTDPDHLYQIVLHWKEERQKRLALEVAVEETKPLVLFAESVQASKTSILIGDLAKIMRQNGVEIGQNRLFQSLRECGYLIKAKGESYNMPTQRSMEQGLFEIKEKTFVSHDGSVHITRTPKVTGKGQIYFINRYLGNCESAA